MQERREAVSSYRLPDDTPTPSFAARPRAGLSSRIVIYRRPVASRAQGDNELTELVRRVVVEQVALMLGRSPEEIDPEA